MPINLGVTRTQRIHTMGYHPCRTPCHAWTSQAQSQWEESSHKTHGRIPFVGNIQVVQNQVDSVRLVLGAREKGGCDFICTCFGFLFRRDDEITLN